MDGFGTCICNDILKISVRIPHRYNRSTYLIFKSICCGIAIRTFFLSYYRQRETQQKNSQRKDKTIASYPPFTQHSLPPILLHPHGNMLACGSRFSKGKKQNRQTCKAQCLPVLTLSENLSYSITSSLISTFFTFRDTIYAKRKKEIRSSTTGITIVSAE